MDSREGLPLGHQPAIGDLVHDEKTGHVLIVVPCSCCGSLMLAPTGKDLRTLPKACCLACLQNLRKGGNE